MVEREISKLESSNLYIAWHKNLIISNVIGKSSRDQLHFFSSDLFPVRQNKKSVMLSLHMLVLLLIKVQVHFSRLILVKRWLCLFMFILLHFLNFRLYSVQVRNKKQSYKHLYYKKKKSRRDEFSDKRCSILHVSLLLCEPIYFF